MGKESPVVYEGFLGDAWNSIKSKAAGAIDSIKTKAGDLKDDAKEKASEVIDQTNKAIESETSNMAKLEKAGTQDAWKLFKAMNGMGTDEEDVREVIDRRSGDLKVLDQEYQKLMITMAEVGTSIKSAGAEVIQGATTGAKIGAGAMAAVAVGGTIMTFLGLASLPLTTALLAPVGAAITGAKIGAAVQGVKELDQWSDRTLRPQKGLVKMLEDEGMTEEAEKIRGALKESNRRLAKSILDSSRTYRRIQWRG